METVATVNVGPATYSALLRPRPRRSRLGWIVGIVVIGGMIISVLLPSLCGGGRETANRIKCASNLKQIGLAITQYAQRNGGQYPPSLAMVLKEEDITSDVMVCPATSDERASVVADFEAAETNAPGHKYCLSYIYVGSRLTVTTALPTTIVAYEPLDNHKGKTTNVLFGDGHVDCIDKNTWLKLAAAAGVSVVPSLATQP